MRWGARRAAKKKKGLKIETDEEVVSIHDDVERVARVSTNLERVAGGIK